MLKKVNQKGFTIIEVLIVLAIAGVIMLVVFLAVPALQRNSRNTQRNSDASQITAAVNECLTNKNGVAASCDTISATEVPLDVAKIRQLVDTASPTGLTNITFCGTGTACVAIAATPPKDGTVAATTNVSVEFGRKCATTGDNVVAGQARQYAVLYEVENASGNGVSKCIDA